ncbi:hypothetical protein ACU4GD_20440 [Cupriavidus basilensis]
MMANASKVTSDDLHQRRAGAKPGAGRHRDPGGRTRRPAPRCAAGARASAV